ncbi:MAG: glycerophosphodiester phosphodiesterase family protein [Flavobacteriales bacterium]|nr:glycerophosphodiester phosphodiesterase [Flavobacteriales bacterium]MCX7769215.1 glycerophosphodiester phosphodiesterase family protein [Flavobacteriales bacterium]MDW8410432.1 glycerophosphodiester phosphodiesterase family protein [Flavobacteriales bacterium]
MKGLLFSFLWICLITHIVCCVQQKTPEAPRLTRTLPENFDIQGHRGARGLMPENTIPAFIHAMQLGVNTLELDVVVSADSQVVVSHEPWFSSEFSSRPNMDVVLPVEEESLSLFEMPYSEIRQYDVGRRGHKNFPRQQRLSACKPLLSQVVDTCEKFWKTHHLPPIRYNVEIKSRPDWDRWRTPPVDVFCRLVYQTLLPFNLGPRLCIQSFDPRALKAYHELDPSTPLAWLSEQGHTPEQIEETLGFKAQIYSPQWKTLTPEVISRFHQWGYMVIPWTVNDTSDLVKVMNMEVDGVITDYPDVALHLAGRLRKTPVMNP